MSSILVLAVIQIDYTGEIKTLHDLNCLTRAAQQDPLKTNGFIQDGEVLFRGHELTQYSLIASLPRKIKNLQKLIDIEKKIIYEAKYWTKILCASKLFYQPSNTINFHKNWYWLTQIQHEEIPTRLLDWSLCSNVALYFAVANPKFQNEDGDLWVFFMKDSFSLSNLNKESIDPLSIIQDFSVSIPVHYNNNFKSNQAQRKILGQQGKFFIRCHSNMFIPLETDMFYSKFLKRYKVPKEFKKNILKELIDENYTDKTIYKSHKLRMRLIKGIINLKVFH